MARHVHIWLDADDPPIGRLAFVSGDGEPATVQIPFVGWLDLLRVMSELLAERAESRPDD